MERRIKELILDKDFKKLKNEEEKIRKEIDKLLNIKN